jgi:hypothetical protein
MSKTKFTMPEGGYYRFTLKMIPIDGGQPQEFQKVIKATSYEEAEELFHEYLKSQDD